MKRIRAIAAPLLALGLVGGCMMVDREPNAPRVSNVTDETVQVSIERGDVTIPLTTLKGGITVHLIAFDGTCTDGTLVAVGPGGDEVDRRTETLCPGQVWSIGR